MMRRVATGLVDRAVDANAARIVGETLHTSGYTEAAITSMLGEDAFSARSRDMPVLLRRLPQTRLGTVVRAFFLILPVSVDDLTKAIGERGVAALEAAGVAEVMRSSQHDTRSTWSRRTSISVRSRTPS
jgi:hypothetical protein